MANVAAKALAVALVNGTPNILTYACPADGNFHSVEIQASKDVTTTETGGAIQVVFTDGVTGHTLTTTIFTGGSAGPGIIAANPALAVVLGSGSTIAINQSSALTAGASKVSVIIDISDAAIPG